MDDKLISQKIMILLKKKLNFYEQILNYTNDMSSSVSQNDFDTLNMLLDMRANVMSDIDSCEEEIQTLIASCSPENRLRLLCQLSDQNITSDLSFEETKIKEIHDMMKTILNKVIELDSFLGMQINAKSKLLSIENS